jgi:hypothetical protein
LWRQQGREETVLFCISTSQAPSLEEHIAKGQEGKREVDEKNLKNLNEERNAEKDAARRCPLLKELHTMHSSKPQPDLHVNMRNIEVIGTGGNMQGIKACQAWNRCRIIAKLKK